MDSRIPIIIVIAALLTIPGSAAITLGVDIGGPSTPPSDPFVPMPTDIHPEPGSATMAEKDIVSVGVGSVYRWEMTSNPTTGYGWYLVSDEGLKVETEFIQKSNLCGAPGTHVFIITSDVKGTFNLTAEYKRPWEDVPPVETRELTIAFE